MDSSREDLAFSENGKSVVKVCNVVLCYIFVCVKWFVTLKKNHMSDLTYKTHN